MDRDGQGGHGCIRSSIKEGEGFWQTDSRDRFLMAAGRFLLLVFFFLGETGRGVIMERELLNDTTASLRLDKKKHGAFVRS